MIMRPVLQAVRRQIQRMGFDINPIDNTYFPDQLELAQATAVNHIVDVGANIGKTADYYAARFPRARLTCVEPIPELATRLRNRFPQAVVLQAAMSDKEGMAEFHVSNVQDTSSLLSPAVSELPSSYVEIMSVARTEVVETITLDSLPERAGIDRIGILKLDLQGGELNALKGGERLLGGQRVDVICTEAFLLPFYEEQPLLGDIVALLATHGYSLHGIYNPVMSGRTGKIQWIDAIFVAPGLRDRSRALLRQRMTR
jgi:FkbM family methyltransferase